jgi:antitoxin StbD
MPKAVLRLIKFVLYYVHYFAHKNGETVNVITPIHAATTVSVTDLRKINPGKILEQAGGNPVAILNHNKPEAYLLSAKSYEKILEILENLELMNIVEKRRGGKTVRVKLAQL